MGIVRLPFFGILFIFSVLLASCADESSLNDSFGAQGEDQCKEVNRLVHAALEVHLTKDEQDLNSVYFTAITKMLQVNYDIVGPHDKDFEALTRQITTREGISDKRLESCQDLKAFQDFRLKKMAAVITASKLNSKSAVKNEIESPEPEKTGSIDSSLENQNLRALADTLDIYSVPKDSKLTLSLGKDPLIFHEFLGAFVEALDPFSGYEFISSLTGSEQSYSFGVKLDLDLEHWFGKVEDSVEVLAVKDLSVGLVPGDRITQIQIPSLASDCSSEKRKINIREALEKNKVGQIENAFANTPCEKMTVDVIREGVTRTLELQGKKDLSRPLVASRLIGSSIIYARLFEFGENAASELLAHLLSKKQELLRLQDREGILAPSAATIATNNFGLSLNPPLSVAPPPVVASSNLAALVDAMKYGIILDLRFNPGGSVREMEQILSYFLTAQTVGKRHTKESLKNKGNMEDFNLQEPFPVFENIPLVILVNPQSGSAAEITTALLKATNRAWVDGELTFGKGIGQAHLPLGLSSTLGAGQLAVTVQAYVDKEGNPIQIAGVKPNYMIAHPREAKARSECLVNSKIKDKRRCTSFRMEDMEKLGRGIPIPATPATAPVKEPAKVSARVIPNFTQFSSIDLTNLSSPKALETDPVIELARKQMLIQLGRSVE